LFAPMPGSEMRATLTKSVTGSSRAADTAEDKWH
jgi:hypothetical protein